jgi:pimeloyl-ACP methyl ester carboxylesterase
MTTFALIHGSWHGAWCWTAVIDELRAAGHDAVAVDLPCDDVAATFEDYASVVVDSLRDAGDDVVVVGHSLGGLTAPLVAARRPVRRVDILCGLIPEPGLSLVEQLAREPEMLVPGYRQEQDLDVQGRSFFPEQDVAIARLYPDCEPATARAAYARLRPQARTPQKVPCRLDALPDVAWRSIVGAEDRVVAPGWSRRAARARLGVEAVELPGGHSPMLARPAALAAALLA